VAFTCADAGGSGIASCAGDSTLGEGGDQSVTGTATDWAGNTATDTVSDVDIDKTPGDVRTSSQRMNDRGDRVRRGGTFGRAQA
jgi:hypothetical protein